MFLSFLIFSAISVMLVKLGALIVWVRVLTAMIEFAMLVIGLLILMQLWRSMHRR